MCSARVTPDQPGERVGATTKNQVESSLSDTRGFRNQLRAWVENHRASCSDSVARLVRQPLGSFFTCLVMAVALSLPMGLALLLENVSQLGGSWQLQRRKLLHRSRSVASSAPMRILTQRT